MGTSLKHSLALVSIVALFLFSACNENESSADSKPKESVESEPPRTQTTQIGTGGETGRLEPPPDSGGDRGLVLQKPAILTVTPSSFDFGIQSVQSSTHVMLTLSNSGEQTARAIQPGGYFGSFGFRQGSFPGFRGTCTTELHAGASCTLWLSFNPTSIGSFSTSGAELTYESGVGQSSGQISLTGRAMNIATLRFSNLVNDDTFWDFGTTVTGSSFTKTIHVYYFGSKTASGVTFSGLTQPFRIESSTCGTEITADCDLVIAFSPTQTGPISNTLKVTYNNSSFAAEDTFGVRGDSITMATPGVLTLLDGGNNSWGNGLVGNSYDRTFLVQKTGSLPVTSISPLSFSTNAYTFKGGSYPGTGGTCTSQISTTCTLVVSFSPPSALIYNDTLRLGYHDGVSSQTASFALSAAGRNRSVLTLTPPTHYFGSASVGYALYKTFTLTNTIAASTASNLTFSGLSSGFVLSSKTCGTSLGPLASCTFTLRFLPTGVFDFTSSLSVSYFDGQIIRSDLAVTLSGSGVGNALLNPTTLSLNFGNVPIGTTPTRSLMLSYFGVHSAQLLSASISGNGFSFAGGSYPGTGGTCGNFISSNCNMILQFSPTLLQAYSGMLSLSYDDGTGTVKNISISLLGTGVSASPAILTVSPAPATFSKIAVLLTTSLKVTISRSGSFAATSLSVSGLGIPFRFKGGSFPGIGGNCSSTLSGSSCTLMFEFAPTIEGTFSQGLTLNYNDGYSAQSTPISLEGISYFRALLAATGIFNLGKVPLGQKSVTDVTVINQGLGMATSISPSLPTPFQIIQSTCGTSLSSNASCMLRAEFTSNSPGAFSQTLTLNYHEGDHSTNLSQNLTATAIVPVKLSTNGNHTCIRTETGSLRCWGQNNYGQLGYEDTLNRLDSGPGPLADVSLGVGRWVKEVATGYWHTCAILDDDNVRCWGSNQYGQLGLGRPDLRWGDRANTMGDLLPTLQLGTAETPISLSLGYAHSCVLFNSGKMKCWGQNSEGQLGLEDTNVRGLISSEMGGNLPYVYLGSTNIRQIAAGESHTCALLDNDSIKCWGNNFFGQLGLGDFTSRGDTVGTMGNALSSVWLGSGFQPLAIAVGGAFSCALLNNGRVKCWGRNEKGILGNNYCLDAGGSTGACTNPGYTFALRGIGTSPDQLGDALPFVDLGTGTVAEKLSVANSSSCVLLSSGNIKCWGSNESGQLGLGDIQSRGLTLSEMGNSLVPLSLGVTSGVQSLALGGIHSCALSNDGRIKCWGDNRYGTLGYGDTQNRGDEPNEMGNSLPYVNY